MTITFGPLMQEWRREWEQIIATVQRDLPASVTSALGSHDVWYRSDESGLWACVEVPGFPPAVLDDDERTTWGILGFRVTLVASTEEDSDRHILALEGKLERLGRDIAIAHF